MTKCTKSILFSLAVVLCALSGASAQTISAASCNESDVSAALNKISADGTVVSIPAGDCVWTTKLSYQQTYSFTLQGAGAVYASATSATGQGSDSTIIEDDTGSANGDLSISTAAGKTFRITGIAFKLNSAQTSPPYGGELIVSGSSTAIRVDHDHFNQIPGHALYAACVNGVIDHTQFDFGSSLGTTDGTMTQDNVCASPTDLWGNASWSSATNFGSSNFVFIEQNSFNAASGQTGYATDCSAGGRFVLRFNTMWYHVLSVMHGTDSSGRGCRAAEEYMNRMTWSATPVTDSANTWVEMESGTALFWGNTLTGYVAALQADVVRANSQTYAEGAVPNGFGYCGTTDGPSTWDGNTNSTGYPCLDGIGRGQGDLISGAFPDVCDATTGCKTYAGSWPNQALEPVYMWDTTYNAPPDEGGDTFWANYPTPVTIAENRDYYLQLPNYSESSSFNGTAGIGQGSLASAPSTCTPGVGYWATDQGNWNQSGSGGQGELYVCSATKAWNLYYEPYTYPHPLDSTGTVTPPPPTGVSGEAVIAD